MTQAPKRQRPRRGDWQAGKFSRGVYAGAASKAKVHEKDMGIFRQFSLKPELGLLAQNVLAAAAEGLGDSLCANGRGVPADKALGDVLWIANVRIVFDVFAYLAIGVSPVALLRQSSTGCNRSPKFVSANPAAQNFD